METSERPSEIGGCHDRPAFKLLLSCPLGLSPSEESSTKPIFVQWTKVQDDWRRCQHTSNPLGNGAIVVTSDEEVVVLQRSTNVGEFPGHFVFPGGHPEPQEVGIISHHTDGELTHQMVNRKVSQEMFDSIIREVVEEIGVPTASLGKPVFIGISQRVLNVRPTAFFFIKCDLPSKDIQQLYCSAQDGYESTQLYTMSMSNLADIASKMPGCHQGGLALYKLMVDAAKENR
ncbi:hypothetical protein DH2020_002996 [Rehmannia glutinosa]|uniref:Nudix hydrolase domain-containing protein n=1 Tax=Rehmannia glutinosa TaxID=99300 RepID=A0ABR0W774_REHGL